MARAPFNSGKLWQAVSGGSETLLKAARRESNEEGGLSYERPSIQPDPTPNPCAECGREAVGGKYSWFLRTFFRRYRLEE